MKKDNNVFKEHIIEAIEKIEGYMLGKTREEFNKDTMLQNACLYLITIIGEASKNISKEEKEKYPYIPWKDIAGMRDKLIHQYFGTDLERVWNVIKQDLPKLKRELQK